MNVNVYKKAQRINFCNQRAQEMRQIDMALESGLSMIQMLIPLGLRLSRRNSKQKSEH